MVDRIRYTSVLGYALVGEVNLAVGVNCYVLKKCIALDSVEDVGLALLVEVDNLGLAPTFEVEHTVVVPAVLVITDKATLRVGRQSGLACT